jgi:hypothetical protein
MANCFCPLSAPFSPLFLQMRSCAGVAGQVLQRVYSCVLHETSWSETFPTKGWKTFVSVTIQKFSVSDQRLENFCIGNDTEVFSFRPKGWKLEQVSSFGPSPSSSCLGKAANLPANRWGLQRKRLSQRHRHVRLDRAYTEPAAFLLY